MIGITGGAGFLGSHLVDALVAKGRRVRVLDDFSSADSSSERARARVAGWGHQVELFEGPTTDAAVVDRFLEGVDRVYHLARVGAESCWSGTGRTCYEREIQGMFTLLDAMDRARVNHLILRSDASVYGETPMSGATADTPLRPTGRRGAAQMAVEGLATAWHAGGHRQLTVLRVFALYGPRMSPENLVHRCLTAAIDGTPLSLPGDQGVVRDFVYAGDAIRILLQSRRAQSERPVIFQVASGRPVNLVDLAAAVRRAVGRAPRVEVGPLGRHEACYVLGDPGFTEEHLHVQADTTLDAGLQKSVAWLTGA